MLREIIQKMYKKIKRFETPISGVKNERWISARIGPTFKEKSIKTLRQYILKQLLQIWRWREMFVCVFVFFFLSSIDFKWRSCAQTEQSNILLTPSRRWGRLHAQSSWHENKRTRTSWVYSSDSSADKAFLCSGDGRFSFNIHGSIKAGEPGIKQKSEI